MKTKIAFPLFAAALLASAAASAATAYTSHRINLRAGPGRDYPTIQTFSRDTKLTVHGCVDRFNWCDVSKGRARGWVDGDSLIVPYQGRRVGIIEYGPHLHMPTVTFSFDNYWDSHYRRASFYHERDVWRARWRDWTRDQDRDGVPNHFDRDRDGDGVRNNRNRDKDGDGVPNNRDRAPNNQYRR